MPFDSLVICLCFISLSVYFVLKKLSSPYSSVPSVRLKDYFTSGLLRALLTNSHYFNVAIVDLWRKYGNVFKVWLGHNHVICTTIPQDAGQILNNTRTFVRPLGMRVMFHHMIPNSLLDVPPNIHRQHRIQLRDSFNYTHLVKHHDRVQHALSHLIQTLTDMTASLPMDQYTQPFQMSEVLGSTTFRIINNVGFGADWDTEELEKVSQKTDVLLTGFMTEAMGYPFHQFIHPFEHRHTIGPKKNDVMKHYHRLVEQRLSETSSRRKSRPDDVLDAILKFENSSIDSFANNSAAFSIAGGHTTSQTIAWALYQLSQYPDVVYCVEHEIQKVFRGYDEQTPLKHEDIEKLQYLRKVWKETLRLHPPAHFLLREATCDVVLKGSGISLRKGTVVLVHCYGLHTREDLWKEPHRFNPDRWGSVDEPREGDLVSPGIYFPFSLGAANCAGQFFANYEGVLILAELLRRFHFRLACDPKDVFPCASWVNVGRISSQNNGKFDKTIPFSVRRRGDMDGDKIHIN